MLGRRCPDDGVEDHLQVSLLAASHFLNHDQLLPAFDFDRKGRPAVGPQPRMGLLDRLFNVLGIEVHTPNDNQVFQPAGDEQFAVLHEPQVPGPKERSFAGVFQPGSEGLLGGLLLAPVS